MVAGSIKKKKKKKRSKPKFINDTLKKYIIRYVERLPSHQNIISEITQLTIPILRFDDAADYDGVAQDDVLVFTNLRQALADGDPITVANTTQDTTFTVRHRLSERQIQHVLAGGLIPWLAAKQ